MFWVNTKGPPDVAIAPLPTIPYDSAVVDTEAVAKAVGLKPTIDPPRASVPTTFAVCIDCEIPAPPQSAIQTLQFGCVIDPEPTPGIEKEPVIVGISWY
jgi:hypothetical protein